MQLAVAQTPNGDLCVSLPDGKEKYVIGEAYMNHLLLKAKDDEIRTAGLFYNLVLYSEEYMTLVVPSGFSTTVLGRLLTPHVFRAGASYLEEWVASMNNAFKALSQTPSRFRTEFSLYMASREESLFSQQHISPTGLAFPFLDATEFPPGSLRFIVCGLSKGPSVPIVLRHPLSPNLRYVLLPPSNHPNYETLVVDHSFPVGFEVFNSMNYVYNDSTGDAVNDLGIVGMVSPLDSNQLHLALDSKWRNLICINRTTFSISEVSIGITADMEKAMSEPVSKESMTVLENDLVALMMKMDGKVDKGFLDEAEKMVKQEAKADDMYAQQLLEKIELMRTIGVADVGKEIQAIIDKEKIRRAPQPPKTRQDLLDASKRVPVSRAGSLHPKLV